MKPATVIAILIMMWLGPTLHAETLDADTIITKAYETPRVDDQIATLRFTFSRPDQKQQQAVYTMIWKNTRGEDGYDHKAMFFTESPQEKKGIAYLGWIRTAGSDQGNDEWIYLPELRMTRRIAHHDHTHVHEEDEFGNSILTREHLEPRPPSLDDHTLIGEAMLEGNMHYLIASTPKRHPEHDGAPMPHETAGKTLHWINKENYRINRAQFFDENDVEILDMKIAWTRINHYWAWETVTAVDPQNQAKTVMEISDIKINSGLTDNDFSKRNLEKGPGRFR